MNNYQLYLLVFGAICTGAATLIGMLHSEMNRKPMHLWTLVVGLIFTADIFALAQQPLPQPAIDPNVPFVVAERILTPIDIDGKGRIESPGLMQLAKKQAELNATTGNYKGHTNLDEYVGVYGVMAENAGMSDSWEGMYRTWQSSILHRTNRNGPFPYIGYHMAKGAGGNYYVVVYGSRKGDYNYKTGEWK